MPATPLSQLFTGLSGCGSAGEIKWWSRAADRSGWRTLAVAKSSGASETIVIGSPAERLELAREFGAEHTINIDEVPEPAGD